MLKLGSGKQSSPSIASPLLLSLLSSSPRLPHAKVAERLSFFQNLDVFRGIGAASEKAEDHASRQSMLLLSEGITWIRVHRGAVLQEVRGVGSVCKDRGFALLDIGGGFSLLDSVLDLKPVQRFVFRLLA